MRLRLFTFLMMFLATMSGAVWGQSYTSLTNAGVRINDDNIYYYTTNGEEIEGGGITVTDGSPTIYLKDVNIKVGGSAIIINNGANPTFVLVGENTITSNGTDAAIRVDVDGELTIAENSKGILTIDVPNTNDYAIGHDFSNLSGCGTINIKGGTIKTNGTIGYAMYHGIRLENSAILIAHDVTGSPNNISLAHSGIYFGGGNTTGHAVEGTEEFVLSSPIPDGYTIDMNNKIFTVGEGGSINTDQVINASTINAYKVSYDLTGAPNQDGVTVSPESIESIYMGPNTELNNTVTVTNSGDAEYTYLGWNNAGNFVTTTPSNNPSGTQDYQATGVFLLTKYTVNIPTGETLSTNINLVLPNTTSGVTISEKQDGNKLSSYGTKIEDTKLIAGESGTSASVGNNQQVTLQASYGSSQTQDITIIFNVSQGKISLDGAAVTLANSEVVYSGSPISTVNVTSVVTTGNVKVTEYDIKFKQKEDDEKYMTVNPKDVGTYYVYAVAKENSSSYEGTSAPATLKITEKPITTITVDPTSLEWTIGKEEPTFTEVKFSSTDIFEDDKENVTISATAPTGEWNTPGTYTVEYTSFSLSGDRSNNYKIGTDTKVSITLTVSKEGSEEQPITPGNPDEDDTEIIPGTIEDDMDGWTWDSENKRYYRTYDGEPHTLSKISLKFKDSDGNFAWSVCDLSEEAVTYSPEGVKNAGEYTAVIDLSKVGSEYYSGTATIKLYIAPRDLSINFFLDGLTEEYIGKKIEMADEELLWDDKYDENIGLVGREEPIFSGYIRIADTENDEGKYDVYYKISIEDNEDSGFLKSNYNSTVSIDDVVITLGAEDETQLPGEGIEIVEESTGGSGSIITQRHQLYLADKDFDKGTIYDEEGLELFSRHNKKYAKTGSSFTIWYEHNGVANDGEYRIFIRRGRSGSWTELKIDTVSDYYQIRNVQTDIYVKIYGLNGYPVANEEISATEARAYAQANKIVVITPEPTDVQIISMAGAVVATDKVTGQREFGNLTAGIYIVRMGETVVKLQVRN